MLAHQVGIRRGSAFAVFCDGSTTDAISTPTTRVIRDTDPVGDFLRDIVPVAGIIRFPDVVVAVASEQIGRDGPPADPHGRADHAART